MIFGEPRIEFVSLSISDVIVTSGYGAEYCADMGDEVLTTEHYCGTMTHSTSNTWVEICATASDWDPTLDDNVTVD